MPFVSSVRGTYGLDRKPPRPWYNLNENNSGVTGGSITTAGGFRIHTFSYTGGNQSFVVNPPSQSFNGADIELRDVEMYMWGGGGGAGEPSGWGRWSSGGGSGFASGTARKMTEGTYLTVVGQSGGAGTSGRTAYGGGGSGFSWGNGGGGGLSGVFANNSFTQGNAVLIVGGGGGGGASRSSNNGCGSGNRGGGGGGSVGQAGESWDGGGGGGGGTQSAGGAGATLNGPTEAGSALQGANRSSNHGAGGGGGYFGGGSGTYFEPNTMGGGGGGSSYFNTSIITSAPVLTSGDRCTTANTGSPFWASPAGVSGQSPNSEGSPGRVVIRYPISTF